MMNNEEKLYLINLKLDFWRERLQESTDSMAMLNSLGNQVKIDSTLSNITNYTSAIEALEQEKLSLTIQG